MKLAFLTLLAGLAFCGMASGSLIYDGTVSSFDYYAPPAGTTYPIGPHGGGGSDLFLVTPTFQRATRLQIMVEGLYAVGAVYEVIVDGVSAGLTSQVPLAGPDYTYGLFIVPVNPGSHTVAFWDITASYVGFTAPFGSLANWPMPGGQIVPNAYFIAGAHVNVQTIGAAATPEPGSGLLLGSALVLAVAMGRFGRRY
jgi:hypothetical protein